MDAACYTSQSMMYYCTLSLFLFSSTLHKWWEEGKSEEEGGRQMKEEKEAENVRWKEKEGETLKWEKEMGKWCTQESHVLRYAIQNESFLLQLYNASLINGFLNTIHYRRRIIKSAATVANKHRITVLNFQRHKYDQSISMVIHAVICCALNIFYVSFNLINNERPSASVSHFTHFFLALFLSATHFRGRHSQSSAFLSHLIPRNLWFCPLWVSPLYFS